MGNKNKHEIIGIRSVEIRMFDGIIRTLYSVRHALELNRNLISLSMLDSSGYSFKSDNSGIKK